MNQYELLMVVMLTALHVYLSFGEVIELENKTYSVNYTFMKNYFDERLEIKCTLPRQPVTWYFRQYVSLPLPDTTHEIYPFEFCSSTGGCSIEDGDVLVVNRLSKSSEGDYICVDEENGDGFTVEGVCQRTPVTPLPFNNKTAFIGDNVTFSCEVDVGRQGCENDVMLYSKMGDMSWTEIYTRYEGTNVIQGTNITIVNVNRSDFNMTIFCMIYDIDGNSRYKLEARLINKDIPTIIERKADWRMIVAIVIPVGVFILVISCLLYSYHELIYYHLMAFTGKLPVQGGKYYHGLILYQEDEETYNKVMKIKDFLPQYRFKEFPPGHGSSDQQAGHSELGLLDQLCQECACVLVMGEVDELELRCESLFEGRRVTHIVMSSSDKGKVNCVYWPDGKKRCLRSRQWTNFIYRVKCGLPQLHSLQSKDKYMPEEELLTSV